MTRTTFTIDDEKLEELRSLAEERGVSVSCLVREAIEEKLSKRPPEGRREKPRSLGSGRSGHRDTSQLASEGLGALGPPPSWR
ncbi:MAG: ribbon-helix-helix protein, CopG family [Chloroflexi bacterium]|nr:ribbon-helix-helix protein, CopG family [Chloroflexota bacterium]